MFKAENYNVSLKFSPIYSTCNAKLVFERFPITTNYKKKQLKVNVKAVSFAIKSCCQMVTTSKSNNKIIVIKVLQMLANIDKIVLIKGVIHNLELLFYSKLYSSFYTKPQKENQRTFLLNLTMSVEQSKKWCI